MPERHIQRGNYASPATPAQQIPVTTPTPTPQPQPAKTKFKFPSAPSLGILILRWWRPLATVAVVILIIFLTYGYITTKNELKSQKSDAKASGQTEIERITNEISKTLTLPKETPTLATVTNASKLQGQEFFKGAKNGDKVLIFQNSGRALLYRPSTHKIIEYSKVDLSTTQQ